MRSGVPGRTRPVARLLGAGRLLASVATSAWSARASGISGDRGVMRGALGMFKTAQLC